MSFLRHSVATTCDCRGGHQLARCCSSAMTARCQGSFQTICQRAPIQVRASHGLQPGLAGTARAPSSNDLWRRAVTRLNSRNDSREIPLRRRPGINLDSYDAQMEAETADAGFSAALAAAAPPPRPRDLGSGAAAALDQEFMVGASGLAHQQPTGQHLLRQIVEPGPAPGANHAPLFRLVRRDYYYRTHAGGKCTS